MNAEDLESVEVSRQVCEELLAGEVFNITVKSQRDWEIFAACVNLKIDSHLEAFTQSDFNSNTGEINIHPREMHIMLRRLEELEGDNWESAYSWRSDIIGVMVSDAAEAS